MPQATQILRQEHDAILKILEAAEEAARRIDAGGPVRRETLSGMSEFLRLFADKCHHAKEEDLLFPLLESRGMPREGGPTAAAGSCGGIRGRDGTRDRGVVPSRGAATAAHLERCR